MEKCIHLTLNTSEKVNSITFRRRGDAIGRYKTPALGLATIAEVRLRSVS